MSRGLGPLIGPLKRPLRALRTWPPINLPLTGALRAGINLAGRRPERLAHHLPRVGEVAAQLPVGGPLRLWSRGDDEIATRVYWWGWDGYEPETGPLFFDLARSARIVLDIGAHVGYFALLAAHANRDGKVYAFEPLPRVYERLQRNVALNKVPNLTCLPLAVGAESGVAEFFHVSRGIPSTSSLSREFMEEIYDLQLEQQEALHSQLTSCQVDVVTIDEFLTEDENRMVDLVKLDTETTEDAALRGMAHTIEQSRPVIVCEILKDRAANLIEDLLRPLGYQYFLLTASGPAPRARITPEFPWFNHVFSPEERSPLDLRMAPSP